MSKRRQDQGPTVIRPCCKAKGSLEAFLKGSLHLPHKSWCEHARRP